MDQPPDGHQSPRKIKPSLVKTKELKQKIKPSMVKQKNKTNNNLQTHLSTCTIKPILMNQICSNFNNAKEKVECPAYPPLTSKMPLKISLGDTR